MFVVAARYRAASDSRRPILLGPRELQPTAATRLRRAASSPRILMNRPATLDGRALGGSSGSSCGANCARFVGAALASECACALNADADATREEQHWEPAHPSHAPGECPYAASERAQRPYAPPR